MNKKILPAMGLALALALGGTGFSALGESSQVAGDIMSSIIGRTEAPPQSGEGEVLDVIQVGYYRYTAEEDGAVIRGWAGSEADVSIPDTLDGLPVVSVGENAFRGNGAIASVTLPEGVRRVEAGAFAECAALHAVNVPDSVTFIAGDAFEGSDSVLLVGAAGGYVQTYAQSAGYG